MGGKTSTITNRVREHRKALALSQQVLADRVGVTRQTIIAVEAERYSPSLELAFRLAHVLETNVETLFQFVPEWD